MATDSSGKLPRGRGPDWKLPEILDLAIARVRFEPPRLRHLKSALAGYDSAIEFRAELSGPVPTRAEGPALFVGDTCLSEGAPIDERRWRFLAFDLHELKVGAPIAWGWTDSTPEERMRTRFSFSLER